MSKKKKVHCKHGLTNQEEIKARKLRRRLEEGDEEYNKIIRTLYNEWFVKPKESFFDWLEARDKILASALKRMEDWHKIVFGRSLD